MYKIDMTGERYGKLVVTTYVGQDTKRQSIWDCQCDCGKTTIVTRSSLISGHTRSCGCIFHKAGGDASNHNGKRAPEYSVWAGMKRRCNNPNEKNYPNYGGRGIRVCQRWQYSYPDFLADVGRRPGPEYSLDRIDNDGDYEPGNVRWATAKEQVANRRAIPKRSWRQAAKHAYAVVDDFESVLSDYTGAPYVVAVDSCTAALHLVLMYLGATEVEIPKHTYVGVAASIKNAGAVVQFRDEDWSGMYKLEPYPVYDCARLFTSAMYIPGTFMCLSFHWTKTLPIGRGGAILCDSREAAEWFKQAAFDGRERGRAITPESLILGWHYYFTPTQAAQGLMLMSGMSEHNDPLPSSDYPDLSLSEVFK